MVALEYAGHTLIVFDDHSYRWISVKRFAWDGSGDDAAILAGLIGHWRYRDTYLSSDSHEQDAESIHGPYRVAEIDPAAFMSVDPVEAAALVEEFSGLYDLPPRPDIRVKIEAIVLSRLHRPVWFRLRDVPEAVHDFGWVLMEFRELVAISRVDGVVLSVVMAID